MIKALRSNSNKKKKNVFTVTLEQNTEGPQTPVLIYIVFQESRKVEIKSNLFLSKLQALVKLLSLRIRQDTSVPALGYLKPLCANSNCFFKGVWSTLDLNMSILISPFLEDRYVFLFYSRSHYRIGYSFMLFHLLSLLRTTDINKTI